MKRGALVLIILVTVLLLSASNVFGACVNDGYGGCNGGCVPPTQTCDGPPCGCVPEFSSVTAILAMLCVFVLAVIIKKRLR